MNIHLAIMSVIMRVLCLCYLPIYIVCEPVHIKRLALWIEGKEVEPFVGFPMDIYVIQDGHVVPYLQDAYFDAQLPILPPDVSLVQITWAAPDALYTYNFTALRSLDPYILYDPLLSIPQFGIIPKDKSVFQMAIPCTNKLTGIASMYIVLYVNDRYGIPVPGSPLKLHMRKRCLAYDSSTLCSYHCKNGGTCNGNKRCECLPGYYGQQCELAACLPECHNNSTCIRPGVCDCAKGWRGRYCEIAICEKDCINGGLCTNPNTCECQHGYYGQYCQYKSGHCEIPCKNGGTCTEKDVCECPTGYNGKFCQLPQCKKSCGNGRCVAVNVCECYQGWRGRSCNKTVRKRDNKSKRRRRRNRGSHYENRKKNAIHQNEREKKEEDIKVAANSGNLENGVDYGDFGDGSYDNDNYEERYA